MCEYQGENVIIMLCTKCNINSKNCYIKYPGNFSLEELKKIFDKIKDKYSIILNETESIFFPEYLKIKRCGTFDPKLTESNKFECLVCNNITVITPDLNIYQCVFDIDKGNEIGRVIDGKIMIYDKYKLLNTSYCNVLKKSKGIGDQL